MTAYAVFEVTATSQGWQEKYLAPTAELVARHGGKYIALAPPEKLEGERTPPGVLVIIEFPSPDALRAWYGDPDYQPLLKLRRGGSDCEGLTVEGR